MAGYLQIARVARLAHARVATARELEARWKALPPDQQDQARQEWDAVKGSLAAVRARLEYGPRGFMSELKAGYRGEETAPKDDPRPLAELAKELHATTTALREKLDAAGPQD